MYKILTKEMLSPAICRMKVHAPRVASSAHPGQFLIVRANEHGERIPLTISDFDADEGTVTIVTQKIGASTKEICAIEVGECLEDVVGPLGLPSDFVEKAERAGGVMKMDEKLSVTFPTGNRLVKFLCDYGISAA